MGLEADGGGGGGASRFFRDIVGVFRALAEGLFRTLVHGLRLDG